MGNKFTEQRKKRNADTSTDELAEKLYEEDDNIDEHDRSSTSQDSATHQKRGKGRPKLEEWEKTPSRPFSFLMPIALKEKINLAASARKLSLTQYIITLIEDDLEKNEIKYQQYKEISERISF